MRTLTILAFAALTSIPALAAPPHACDFITAQTASAVFGKPLHAGKEGTVSNLFSQCVFADDFIGSVNFSIGNLADMATSMHASPAQVYQISTTTDTGEIANAFPGLGEWNSYNPTTFDLKVIYHGKILTLTVSASKNPAIKTAMGDTLRQILSKV